MFREHFLQLLEQLNGRQESGGLNNPSRLQSHLSQGARELHQANTNQNTDNSGPFGANYINSRSQRNNTSLISRDRAEGNQQADYNAPGSVDPRVGSGHDKTLNPVVDQIAARVPDYGKEFVSKLVRAANDEVAQHQLNMQNNPPEADIYARDRQRWVNTLPDNIYDLEDDKLENIHRQYKEYNAMLKDIDELKQVGYRPELLQTRYDALNRAAKQLEAVNAEYDRRHADKLTNIESKYNFPDNYGKFDPNDEYDSGHYGTITSQVGANVVETSAELASGYNPEQLEFMEYFKDNITNFDASQLPPNPHYASIGITVNKSFDMSSRKGSKKTGETIAKEAFKHWKGLLKVLPPNTIVSNDPYDTDGGGGRRAKLYSKAGFGPVYGDTQYGYWDGKKLHPIELDPDYET